MEPDDPNSLAHTQRNLQAPYCFCVKMLTKDILQQFKKTWLIEDNSIAACICSRVFSTMRYINRKCYKENKAEIGSILWKRSFFPAYRQGYKKTAAIFTSNKIFPQYPSPLTVLFYLLKTERPLTLIDGLSVIKE